MFTKKELEHLANLARIELGEKELSKYSKELNAILEYMAAVLPVSGTDLPGIREAIGHGEQAEYLAPPRDVNALSERIIRLLPNRSLCHRLGEVNQKRVQTKFTYEKMIEKSIGIIQHHL